MLIDLMGGRIGVESDGWSGSRFWFEVNLPRALDAPSPACVQQIAATERAPNVLLAEDNPALRQLIRALLGPFGMEVHVVENGAEAVEAVRYGLWDVVLMDMQMPVMDGPTAARAIRGLPGPQGQVPIIALTANVMPEQVAVCRAAGMQAHVGKPVQTAELVSAIIQVLSAEAGLDSSETPQAAAG
jgi:CheY-like chemotaxis protein